MSDAYLGHLEEVNKDLKTMGERSLTIKLTEKQASNLELMALSVGLNSSEDLVSYFIGDLTNWGHTNGSDERMLANDWFERAWGVWKDTRYYFKYHLYNYDLLEDTEELRALLENEKYFEEVYDRYKGEGEGKELDSKENCLKLLRELLEKE